MEREPLDLLRHSVRDGAVEFFESAKACGFKLGVFSDYPAAEKLAAMGLTRFFDVVVTAQDPEVQRFKPNAQGIEVALRRLGAERRQALYIGDRPDVDVAAASGAGIPCIIIGRGPRRHGSYAEVSSFHELRALLCRR
jgi:phosphoglycolate phosphatase-like HAD superfamily hydrolase